MPGPLHDLRILVTRPLGPAQHLAQLIRGQGGDVTVVPVMAIRPADPKTIRETVRPADQYDLAVFVSPNAVRHGLEWFSPRKTPQLKFAAVGPTTASALIVGGAESVIQSPDGFTSEALLAVPELQDVDGLRVVIVRGNGGRDALERGLAERGARVEYAEVYCRDIPATAETGLADAFFSGPAPDVVIATSVETLNNIHELLAPPGRARLLNTLLLTASPRVVRRAAELGFAQTPLLAKAPDDNALVIALKSWAQSRRSDAPAAGDGTQPSGATEATPVQPDPHPDDKLDDIPHTAADHDDGGPPVSAAGSAGPNPAVSSERNESAPGGAKTPHDTTSDPMDDGEIMTKPTQPVKTVKSGRALAAFALLIALTAVAGCGYLWWTGQQRNSSVLQAWDDALREATAVIAADIDSVRRTTAGLERDLSRVQQDSGAVSALGNTTRRMESRIEQVDAGIDTVSARMQILENNIGAIRGVSDAARNTWIRAEIEYFLQTANSRLQLAEDPTSALAALRAADDRIQSLGDPMLTPVRARLAGEIAAIEAMPRPDIEGMALRLNSMASRVAGFPVRGGRLGRYDDGASDAEKPAAGWARAKGAIVGALEGMVTIRPSDTNLAPLLAPEEEYFLYRNVELQLQVARLSLLRGDRENFRSSLRTVRGWLDTFFKSDDSSVRSAIGTLADMEGVEIRPAIPDISGSLALLRSLSSTRTGVSPGQMPGVTPGETPGERQ